MKRTINDKGLNIIEQFEGLSLTPYLCPANVWTIGIGTTKYPDGTPVDKDDKPITKSKALEYLRHDVTFFCNQIELFLLKKNIYLSDNKFSALVSFCYNVGLSPLITPGKLMHDGIIKEDSAKIEKAFMAYTKVTKVKNGIAKKVELPGLVKRRKAEMDLFFSKE